MHRLSWISLTLLVGCPAVPGPTDAGPQLTEAGKRAGDPQKEAEAAHAVFERVANAFLADVSAGRYADAYAKTGTPYRGAVALNRFAAGVGKNALLTKATHFKSLKSTTTSGSTIVHGLLETGGSKLQTDVHLLHEGSGLTLTGFTIGGIPSLPTP